MSAIIAVGKGLFTTVDDWHWAEIASLPISLVNGYPRITYKRQSIYLHTFIYTFVDPIYKGLVDHQDTDILNNQEYNLRPATPGQNIANSRLSLNNTSGVKGVCFMQHNRKWRAKIGVNYKDIHLGDFDTLEEATAARQAAAIYYFGAYARET